MYTVEDCHAWLSSTKEATAAKAHEHKKHLEFVRDYWDSIIWSYETKINLMVPMVKHGVGGGSFLVGKMRRCYWLLFQHDNDPNDI